MEKKMEINPSRELLRLAAYACKNGLIEKSDIIYCINRAMALLGLSAFDEALPENLRDFDFSALSVPDTPTPILEALLDYAAAGEPQADTQGRRDLLDTELMAVFTPRPSAVIKKFRSLYGRSPEDATDWFYAFSAATNYIRADRIARDLHWTSPSPYGDMQITINLSKPEKDPRDIIAAGLAPVPDGKYPLCVLCRENEGHRGGPASPARANHRIIPLSLGGEEWYFQYSPYVYYNEHCIALSAEHRPMAVGPRELAQLLDFIDLFPHYFIGSNAGLPIVGGSILSHEHFQGGRFTFPMELAHREFFFEVPGFESVSAAVLKWPLSVLRLRSPDREAIFRLGCKILDFWENYSDGDAGVFAHTDGAPHNAITPIARKKHGEYELDLTLRNNRTGPERPLGLFHPAPERHHIKKENIGLIEVMGLAVLPGRLKASLEKIQGHLEGDQQGFYSDESLAVHTDWYESLRERRRRGGLPAGELLRIAVGEVFTGCLEDCAVFAKTPEGDAAFKRFTDALIRA